ncbi:MMPL family transporter [Zhihengliuella flava]|uniref:RND superfamily putative drug exporter n=1 Tax=Zhihengliuella flava TaxID=1285193 RepID=A0A931D8Z1_9MICC|nr:MMPL family transporter [Zhihengliuella flava]MBG6084208.1 RND superfamily putative drug exporter [Zhihengliuella flava]
MSRQGGTDTRQSSRPRSAGRGGAVLRAAGAVAAIALWLAVMAVGGPTFGQIGSVQTTDRTTFLPESAEATRAVEWQEKFAESDAVPAIVVLESSEELAPPMAEELMAELDAASVDGRALADTAVIGPLPADDALALQLVVPLSAELDVEVGVEEVRDLAAAAVERGDFGEGAQAYVTGPAGFSADLVEAFGGIDGVLLIVALIAVLVILLVVYRSVLLPFSVLITAMAALCAAIVVVYQLAAAELIRIDGQSQGILSILVIGAATDYCLLIVARFREALMEGHSRWTAVRRAWVRSLEPIAASSGTVVVGLLCLMFSDLNSNKALGPIAASGIVFSVLAALTLLPALLGLLGRAAFWPVMPKPTSEAAHVAKRSEHRGWFAVARWVRRRHRPVWILTTLVLAAGCLGVTQLQASGVPESSLVLGSSDAREGQEAIGRHFDAGSGSPTLVYADEAVADEALETVQGTDGVASAYLTAEGGGPVRPGVDARAVEGRVQIEVTLADPADSAAAEDTVVQLRDNVHALDDESLVGGPTATALDKETTAQQDNLKIIPLVFGAILLILMLLLRSIVAPVVLILTTVLSYGTAMGVSALVFNGLYEFPGADPTVPLFGFVFLVALGVDYNIFLMSRAREEVRERGVHDGMTHALAVTGGVITSAGVVLAATFAALSVVPIMFMVQLGFIVAFGVLLDTLVVRTLLVPALSHELGRWLWWPSKLFRRPGGLRAESPDADSEADAERSAALK